ncbi:hypothetical protein Tco_1379907 [Tanacetum coccineum]
MKKAFQDMLHGLGEVNPTYAYYNGSCTSKDTEDPSWSTSFKTRRTQKTSSAMKALWKTLFVLYLYLIGRLIMGDNNEMTMEEYMEKTRTENGAGVELKDTPFGGTNEEDANEYVEKVLEISEMFNLLSVSKDQIMLTIFPKTVIEAAKRWIKSEPSGTITTWNYLKSKFLAKYFPLFKTTRCGMMVLTEGEEYWTIL